MHILVRNSIGIAYTYTYHYRQDEGDESAMCVLGMKLKQSRGASVTRRLNCLGGGGGRGTGGYKGKLQGEPAREYQVTPAKPLLELNL